MNKPKPRWISADFGGFDWVGAQDPTPVQLGLAAFLARWTCGTHHFNGKVSDWGRGIALVQPCYGVSTYDFANLTALVLLAHKFFVRVEIEPVSFKYLRVICHQRQPKVEGDKSSERHPSLDDLIQWATKMKEVAE
jgi:hypothetical protein